MPSSPHTQQKSFMNLEDAAFEPKDIVLYKNTPSDFFSAEETDAMGKAHPFALIGKFSIGWPRQDLVLSAFSLIEFTGPYDIKFLRPGFLFIDFQLEEDMARFRGKGRWFIHGYVLQVLKWSPTFDYQK